MIGTTLGGRYLLLEQIGSGGMGVVYRAEDARLHREVALKVIAPHLMEQESARKRFVHEAQILAALKHPNIVTLHDVGEDAERGVAFLVMELLEGQSLRDIIEQSERPTLFPLALQLCRALESAHSHNVLHRDLKPENIILCPDGLLKLMDFGLSRLLGSHASAQSSAVVGTYNYMAPEQIRGLPLDGRADLYAMGVILYEYLSGALPFPCDNPASALLQRLTQKAMPLRTLLPEIDAGLDAVIMRLLETDPEARFASARDVANALERPSGPRQEARETDSGTGPRSSPIPANVVPEADVGANPVPQGNLPVEVTSFVGREKELEEIKPLLRQAALLTLTGTGGCGKTRLALRLANEMRAEYPDGVWMIGLAPLSDPRFVPQAVASTLGVQEEGGKSLQDMLIAACRTGTRLLLIDNCEHLRQAVAKLSSALLRSCPGLRILATSREPLGVSGETSWSVPALGIPDSEASLSAAQSLKYPAIRLFVERAKAARPQFALTEQNAGVVAYICRRLDGVPLAVELAAARVRSLRVENIAEGLQNYFRLLTEGPIDAEDRQQTLDATIGWSYDLLQEEERTLFNRLSVFANGWTLTALDPVCTGGDSVDDSESETLLLRLVDKSLVIFDEPAARYRLLEMLRQYGNRKLQERGEEDAIRDRHRDYYLQLAEEAEPNLQKPDQKEWLDRLEAEHDNFRAALAWSLEPVIRLRLASALHRFWYIRGHVSEGRGWLENALKRAEHAPTEVCAKALNAIGILAWAQGDLPAARRFYERGLTLRRELDDRSGIAACLNNLGIVASQMTDYTNARKYLEESRVYYQETGNDARRANVLGNLGSVAVVQGDMDAARDFLQEALDLLVRSEGDRSAIADVTQNLANLARKRGDVDHAVSYLRDALALSAELGDRRGMALSLTNLAFVFAAQQRLDEAVVLFGASEKAREANDAPLSEADSAEYNCHKEEAQRALGEEAFRTRYLYGQRMSFEEAVAFVLEGSN